jgi:opacity protein-like surface antigen
MKKLILTAVAAACIATSAIAQSPVTFGVRAGLNINTLSGEDVDDMDSKIGFNVGALVGYSFTDMLGLQSGLLFNTRGASSKEDELEMSMSIYELQVPVFLTGTFALNDDLNIKANVGPTFGFGLSGNVLFQNDGTKMDDYSVDDIYKKEEGADKSMAKRFDLGVAFGAGVEFKKIYLGVGYDLGLTSISNSDDAIKTGSFTINVGFTF